MDPPCLAAPQSIALSVNGSDAELTGLGVQFDMPDNLRNSFIVKCTQIIDGNVHASLECIVCKQERVQNEDNVPVLVKMINRNTHAPLRDLRVRFNNVNGM
jgi:hypothetical protein